MEIRFPQTCAGYFGELRAKQSLNSRFFALVHANPELLKGMLLFPQRIPRGNYFDEIIEAQDDAAAAKIAIFGYIRQWRDASKQLAAARDPKHSVHYINLIKLLLRCSDFDFVAGLDISWVTPELEADAEVQLGAARSSRDLDEDQTPDLAELKSLVERSLPNGVENISLNAILPVSRYIVGIFRYRQGADHLRFASKLANNIMAKYESFSSSSLKEVVQVSYGFRAIAMVSQLGLEFVRRSMDKALKIAESLPGETEIEELVAKENIYTCMQSMTKMHLGLKDYSRAESYLQQMISTDPCDPIAYLEFGLFLQKQNRFEEAFLQFDRATNLGPPGMAMNHFFAGQALAAIGRGLDAKARYYRSAELDRTSVSPLLELVKIVKEETGAKSELMQLLQAILNDRERASQLEDDERLDLEQLLTSLND